MNKFKKLGLAMLIAAVGTLVAPSIVSQGSGTVAYAAKKATVKLNVTSKKLNFGGTVQLKLTGNKQKITWSTSNKNVATVSKSGKVTSVNNGTAIIKATVGKKSYKCNITVLKPIISDCSIKLGLGDKHKLSFKNNSKAIKWMSTKPNVASVDSNGNIKALSEGNVYIDAYISNKRYVCAVAVKDANNTSTTVGESGFLGLSISYAFDHSNSSSYKDSFGIDSGCYVMDVLSNSQFDGKIKYGDIITKVNGRKFFEDGKYIDLLGNIKKGDTVEITYAVRNGAKFVEKNVSTTINQTKYSILGLSSMSKAEEFFGVKIVTTSMINLPLPKGIYVAEVTKDGIISRIDVKKGDIISELSFAGYTINTAEEIEKLFAGNFESTYSNLVLKIIKNPIITLKRYRLVDSEYKEEIISIDMSVYLM